MTEQPLRDSIGNRYKIESRIGEGGMGTVYKAHDSLLEITVAIKKLHQTDSPDAAVRFQNEAVALGKLNHPNIARILDFANDADSLHMVIEYLEGKSLSEVIGKEQLPLVEVVEIFIAIADAMIHAHKNDVLHRDLKPSNIIIVKLEDGTRVPKVVDFGIAKLRERDQHLTATGVGIGSPSYMSPEQARNDNVDERSDIYSFACMMYETLTGRAPLRGNNALETIQKQTSETPLPVDAVNKDLTSYKKLVSLIERSLAKEPQARPQNFEQVQKELVEALNEIHEVLEQSEADDSEEQEEVKELEAPPPVASPARKNTTLIVVSVMSIIVMLLIWGVISSRTPSTDLLSEKTVVKPPETLDDASETLSQFSYESKLPVLPPKQSLSPDGSVLQVEGPIADTTLSKYEGNRQIRVLNVENCTKNGGSPLRFFIESRLHTVALDKCNFDDSELQCIAKIPKLSALKIKGIPGITDKAMTDLAKLQYLNLVTISHCDHVTNKGLSFVTKLGNLYAITLDGIAFTDECLPYLENCRGLWSLGLCNTMISAKALNAFLLKKPLRVLAMNQQDVDDELIKTIAQSGIETANFKDTGMSKTQIEFLSTSKHLSTLVLDDKATRTIVDKAQPVAVGPLKACATLKELRLYNIDYPVPDDLLNAISELPLSTLWLEDCGITDDQLLRLLQMKSVNKFYLVDLSKVSENAKSRFKKLVQENNHDCFVDFEQGYD